MTRNLQPLLPPVLVPLSPSYGQEGMKLRFIRRDTEDDQQGSSNRSLMCFVRIRERDLSGHYKLFTSKGTRKKRVPLGKTVGQWV